MGYFPELLVESGGDTAIVGAAIRMRWMDSEKRRKKNSEKPENAKRALQTGSEAGKR